MTGSQGKDEDDDDDDEEEAQRRGEEEESSGPLNPEGDLVTWEAVEEAEKREEKEKEKRAAGKRNPTAAAGHPDIDGKNRSLLWSGSKKTRSQQARSLAGSPQSCGVAEAGRHPNAQEAPKRQNAPQAHVEDEEGEEGKEKRKRRERKGGAARLEKKP